MTHSAHEAEIMDELAAAVLDQMTEAELAQVEADVQIQLGVYARHVVGLLGHCEIRNNPSTWRPVPPFCQSTVVIDIRGQWYFLTAGHVVKQLLQMKTDPRFRLRGLALDDTFSPAATDQNGIDGFDFDADICYFRDSRGDGLSLGQSEGLDVGFIHIRPLYRELLKKNGIEPVTQGMWNSSSLADCSTYLMAGFQREGVDARITDYSGHYRASIRSRLTYIMVEQLDSDPVGEATTYPRFCGRVGPDHQVGDLDGMSGGPLFAFVGAQFEPYFLAGIQASWHADSRVIYATPINVALQCACDFLRQTEDRWNYT